MTRRRGPGGGDRIERGGPSSAWLEGMRAGGVAVLALTALRLAPAAVDRPRVAQLRVVNGDFSDLTGLSPADGNGWRTGAPAGWRTSSQDLRYAVNTGDEADASVCNVSQLDVLEQTLGVLGSAADVALQFDVSDPWQPNGALEAAIVDGGGRSLAVSSFQAGRGQRLAALRVPAGTTIIIRFRALRQTTPGLGGVSVKLLAPGAWRERQPRAAPVRGAPGPMGGLDAAFRDPPNRFRVIQYSGHGGAAMPIAKLREYGVGGVLLFLSSHNFLRDEGAWTSMLANIDAARLAGMQVWVADDNGYPSGSAGGRVPEADPAFDVRGVTRIVRQGEGSQVIQLALPEGAESFLGACLCPVRDGRADLAAGQRLAPTGGRIEARTPAGPWVIHAFVLQTIRGEGMQSMTTRAGFGTSGRYPDLMSSRAMERFVEMSHAEYARRLGTLRGRIDLFYSNEPNLMTTWHTVGARPDGVAYLPWDAALPARFRQDHGYDLLPALPALFEGDGEGERLARRHFYQTVGSLFRANFSGRIARWTEAHGVRSGGHLLLEERPDAHVIGYGDLFKAIGDQHVPGCDVPMPDLGRYWNYWMPALISSAAQLRGRETVSALLDPMIDRARPSLTPTPERMMRIANMAFLMGINQITTYILWEKYQPMAYRQFNERVGRLSAMLRGARSAAEVAIYYPIETFQALYRPTAKNWMDAGPDCPEAAKAMADQDLSARTLAERGYDFRWLDGDAVLAGRIRDGRLVVGASSYRAIIMAGVGLLPLAVVRRLEAFEKAGGRVVWVGSRPALGDGADEHAQVRAAMAARSTVPPERLPAMLGPAPPAGFRLRAAAPGDALFTARFVRQGRRMTYLVNNSRSEITPRLSLRGSGSSVVWIYDPADGAIRPQRAPSMTTLAPWSSIIAVEPSGPAIGSAPGFRAGRRARR